MTLISGLFAGVMCFLPGPFLLDYLVRSGRLRLTKTEMVLLGSLVWNFSWVSTAYFVAILTSLIDIFYLLLLGIGAAIILLDLYEVARDKSRLRFPSIGFDSALASVLIGVLGALVTIEIVAHSIYVEYDAIFNYLPLAKSIVMTGGLNFDPLHTTGLSTTLPPALPLMYGSVLFFSGSLTDFGMATRIIPLVYVALTSLGVYALASEFFEDSKLALASVVCFLSMPVLMSMSLEYSLYLDLGLVFATTVSMYLIVRVGRHEGGDSFGWLALGISLGFLMLTKDTAYFIVPSLFILAIIPRLRSLGRNLAALLGALMFTGTYTFFSVVDVLFFSELGIIATQTTVLAILVLSFLILRRVELQNHEAPSGQQVMLLVLPFASAAIYILRNLLEYRVVSYNLTWFNATVSRAQSLIAQSSGQTSRSYVPCFQNLIQILSNYNAGFVFLTPLVLGILGLFIANRIRPERRLAFSLFWLALIGLWGWEFNFAYISSNVRWMYPFAPLLAVLAAAGVEFVSRVCRLHDSIVIRLVFFESLVLLYLWTGPLNLSVGGVTLLGAKLVNGIPSTLQSLSILALLFAAAFIPIRFKNPTLSHNSRRVGRIIVVVSVLALLIFPVYAFASPAIANSHETAASVPFPGWENNLSEVIDHINNNLTDNYAIIVFYGRPIAYFTNYPIIDLTAWYGVASVLDTVGVNDSRAMNVLLNDGVHYLLIPSPSNNFYQYYLSLSRNFTYLSPASLHTNPQLTLVSNFSDYQLFRIETRSG